MTLDETLQQAFVHHQAGRFPEAEVLYRQILAVEPRHFDGLHLLGVVAHQVGRHDIALDLIGQALAVNPVSADAHCNLGSVYKALGRIEDALASSRRAVELNPNQAMAHSNLGLIFHQREQYEEAIASFSASLAIRPDQPQVYNHLGVTLNVLGRVEEALPAFQRAIDMAPGFAEAWSNLGLMFHATGRLDEARAAFARALEINPGLAASHNNLGAVLGEMGLSREAEASYRTALALDPDYAMVCNNLGSLLQQQGKVAEAAMYCERAIALDPQLAIAHDNLGLSLAALGDFARARHHYETAIALVRAGHWNIVQKTVWHNLILTVDHAPEPDEAGIQGVRKAWAATLPRAPAQVFPNTRDPERRLRIGYVSGDYWGHSAAAAFEPVLRCHDRSRFELYLYSNRTAEDEHTARFRNYAAVFRPVKLLSDDAVETLIRQDAVDILVDLSGHSAGTRLPVFARKPAPVQVTAWGFITGTGLPEIDYLFGDPVAVPSETRRHFAERIWDLPSILPFRLPEMALEPNRLPALTRGYVTFGCINRLMKMWPAFPVFGRLLKELPDARLIIKARGLEEPTTQERVLRILAEHGGPPERVELRGPSSSHEHLATLQEIDIGLDSIPQTGGVTTLECLWLGVPVVTMTGPGISARVAASLLTTLGLTDLIAADRDGYVAVARRLAGDLPALAQFRQTARERLKASPICGAEAYTAKVEEAYREMWRIWCGTGAGAKSA